MEPGNHYIVVYYAWTDTDKNFPIYEESLGEFIRNCPEIPDWHNSVLEFTRKTAKFINLEEDQRINSKNLVPIS